VKRVLKWQTEIMILRSEIRRYVKAMVREFAPQRVVLFGSYARGKPTEDSDVDLLVIMNHKKRKNVEQVIDMRLRMD
jgi:predicted nucleotidyltransferase